MAEFRDIPPLINAAEDVMTAINNLVIFQKFKNGDYHGISIFLPDSGKWYKDGSGRDLPPKKK